LTCAAYDLLKVVEQQRLQLIEDDTGNIIEMIMTTQPAIKEVPVMGTVPMGTVTIRACTEPGVDGCVVSLLSSDTYTFHSPFCNVAYCLSEDPAVHLSAAYPPG